MSALWCMGPGPRGPGAAADLLVGGLCPDMADCGAMVVLGLVSTCWWVGPGPRGSQGLCPPTGG